MKSPNFEIEDIIKGFADQFWVEDYGAKIT
jgi:hypothetical protein